MFDHLEAGIASEFGWIGRCINRFQIDVGVVERMVGPSRRCDRYGIAIDIPLDGRRVAIAIRYGRKLPGAIIRKRKDNGIGQRVPRFRVASRSAKRRGKQDHFTLLTRAS